MQNQVFFSFIAIPKYYVFLDKKDLFLRKNTYNMVCPTPLSCS